MVAVIWAGGALTALGGLLAAARAGRKRPARQRLAAPAHGATRP
jgi:cytochrome c biogenesis factor